MPRVEVIVVTWNGRADTLLAVEAVLSQSGFDGSGDARLTVVDNGSTDGTAEEVRRRFPEVRVLRHATNRGFTGGVRTGVEASDADAIVLLNNDAVPEPGWLAALVRALRAAPEDVISVGGKIVDPSGTRADFVRGAMTFDAHGFQPGFRKPLDAVDEPRAGAEILFACGGNMIARREAFLRIGGFDDDYFAYLEDVDFGWRSWLSGSRVLWEPAAVVRHRSSATSERLGAFERGILFERNALQTAVKNYEDATLRLMAGPIFLTALHRLHRYTVERNEGTEPLTRAPLDELTPQRPHRRSLLGRLRRKLGIRRAGDAPVLEDGLTAMQFRALEWFFRSSDAIFAKRTVVQALRRRPDGEILERFPLLVVPTYHGDEALMRSPLFDMLLGDVPRRRASLDEIQG